MPSTPVETISDNELREATKLRRVSSGRAIETADGYLLALIVVGREKYLATRDRPESPRQYKTFESLTTRFREACPGCKLEYDFLAPITPPPALKRRKDSSKKKASKNSKKG